MLGHALGGLLARSLSNTRQERSEARYSATRLTDKYVLPEGIERSGRVTDASNRQFARIQKIAAKLFAAKGFRAVGVAEICDAVGLGRGALYYHISSKEDLLFSIVVHHIEALVAFGRDLLETETEPRKRIHALSHHLTGMIFTKLPEMTVCFREADCLTGQRHRIVAELHEMYQNIWTDTLLDGAQKGIFRPLPAVAINGILGMHFHSFLWLKSGATTSSIDLAAIFADMATSIAELGLDNAEVNAP